MLSHSNNRIKDKCPGCSQNEEIGGNGSLPFVADIFGASFSANGAPSRIYWQLSMSKLRRWVSDDNCDCFGAERLLQKKIARGVPALLNAAQIETKIHLVCSAHVEFLANWLAFTNVETQALSIWRQMQLFWCRTSAPKKFTRFSRYSRWAQSAERN